MVADGDWAMRTTERSVDVWESGVWGIIFELAEVAAGVVSAEGKRRGDVYVSKFLQAQESSPTMVANSS